MIMDNQNNQNSYINTNATENSSNSYNNYNFKSSKKPKEKKSKNGSSFTKTVLLPFASGIIGATLVVGLCFSIPGIKSEILGTNSYIPKDNNSNINYNNKK